METGGGGRQGHSRAREDTSNTYVPIRVSSFDGRRRFADGQSRKSKVMNPSPLFLEKAIINEHALSVRGFSGECHTDSDDGFDGGFRTSQPRSTLVERVQQLKS